MTVPNPNLTPTAEAEAAAPSDPSRRKRPTRSSQLFYIGTAGLVAALGYYFLNARTGDPLHLYIGLLILVNATLPALLWAKRGDFSFPVFQVFMLTAVTGYAIPLLNGQQQLDQFSAANVTKAGFGVLLFQIAANATYAMVRARPRTSSAWTAEIIAKNVTTYLESGMIFTTLYTAFILLTDWIPYEIQGVLRAVGYGIGIMASFILSRMWGQGVLPPRKKTMLVVLITLQVLFSWTALFLIGGISILVLSFLGYVTGSKRLPLIPLAITVVIVGLLHNGKSTMRFKYWEGGAPAPTVTEIPAFFIEWVGYSLDGEIALQRKEQSNRLLERTSLLHILCLVTSFTPERQPFLNGLTYGQIPSQFVPRFFWPNKPVGHISTHTLSIYYGLQQEEDTGKTTIAFGLLSEAYANFGYFGLIAIGMIFAGVFKIVSDRAAYSPILSYPGLFQIVLMAWSFQSEMTLSIWISSLYQACVAVLGVPFVIRNLLGR